MGLLDDICFVFLSLLFLIKLVKTETFFSYANQRINYLESKQKPRQREVLKKDILC